MILPGLSITALEPLWIGTLVMDQLTEEVDAYQHEIKALGGYWAARFTIGNDRLRVEDWFTDGLGRHIEVYDDALVKIWEGFVNKVTTNNGPLTEVRGPLLDVANQVDLVYSTLDSTTTPPTVGLRVNTGVLDDLPSQALYGILPVVLSTGGVDEAGLGMATQIRGMYLDDSKLPTDSQQFSNSTPGQVSVTVECLGYIHWLNYPYNYILNSGAINASDKIIAILGATPNVAWLAFNTTNVDANVLQVMRWEDEDNLAWSVIQDVVKRGEPQPSVPPWRRWLFGVYSDLEARYQAAPIALEYEQLLSDPKLRVTDAIGGSEVYPWNVLPGRWLMWPDWLVGKTQPASLREDARAAFIESAIYTAPQGLVFKGGKYDKLPQLLAHLGLSGVGG